MTKKSTYGALISAMLFSIISATAYADDVAAKAECTGGGWGCTDDWNLTFSVPVIKLRQGEKASLFEGLAVGLQLNNVFSRTPTSLFNAIIITPALMFSTTTSAGSTTASKESDYVLSGAVLFGIRQGNKSFQVGWAYDGLSSESADIFKNRERSTVLFNIGTGI